MGGSGGTGTGGARIGLGYTSDGPPIVLTGVSNASDIAWKPASDTFFIVADRELYEYDARFTTVRRTVQLGAIDPEGIAYLGPSDGGDLLALAVEGPDDVVLTFDLPLGATEVDLTKARTYVPAPAPPIVNKGWEGVAYRPAAGAEPAWLYACQEGEPGQVPIRVVRFPYMPDGTSTLSYADGTLAVEEPWDALAKLGSYEGDLSGLYFDTSDGTLLVMSQIAARLWRVDPATGDIRDEMTLDRSPQYEGVTLTSDGRMVLVSEPNFVEIFRRNVTGM